MEGKNVILHIFMYNVISDFSAATPASEGRVNKDHGLFFKIIISIGRTYSGVPRMFFSFNTSVVEVSLLSEGERDLCLEGGSLVSSSIKDSWSLDLSSVLGLK